MKKIVAVRLREVGLTGYFICEDLEVNVGDYVIVEAERGLDYGQVISEVEEDSIKSWQSFKKIVRIMSLDDL